MKELYVQTKLWRCVELKEEVNRKLLEITLLEGYTLTRAVAFPGCSCLAGLTEGFSGV